MLQHPYRYCILIASVISICLTGQAIVAQTSFHQLMQLNHAYEYLENVEERQHMITQVLGYGISWCLLTGSVMAPMLNILGSKVLALVGILLHFLGYVLLFFFSSIVFHHLGVFCFGLAFQCIFNSHVGVAELFPECPNLILSILGAAPDISMFLPSLLYEWAQNVKHEFPVLFVLKKYLLLGIPLALVLDAIFLPRKNDQLGEKEQQKNQTLGLFDPVESGSTQVDERSVLIPLESQPNHQNLPLDSQQLSYFRKLTFKQQLLSLPYGVFTIYALVIMILKKYHSMDMYLLLKEADHHPDKYLSTQYTRLYNNMLPYGFVTAIGCGALVDRIGIFKYMILSISLATTYIAFILYASLAFQIVTLVLFVIYQSFILGQISSFLIALYGFENLIPLQTFLTTLLGLACLAIDIGLYPFVTRFVKSHRQINFYIFFVAVATFSVPFYFLCVFPKYTPMKSSLVDSGSKLPLYDSKCDTKYSKHEKVSTENKHRIVEGVDTL